MRYLDIPKQLFREFSQSDGYGNSYEGWAKCSSLGGDLYTLVEIDPRKHFSADGLLGALGWYSSNNFESTCFAIWARKPEGNADSIGEPEAILTIRAHVGNGGMWAAERGILMREKISAHTVFSYGTPVNIYLMPLIARVLARAHQLTLDSGHEEFWEVEKNPQGDFSNYD